MKSETSSKTKNIFFYFLKMVILFMILFFIQQLGSLLIYNGVNYLKYGSDIIFEAIFAGLILITLLLFKNSYIFTRKKTSFLEGFKYCWPELVISLVFLVNSIFTISSTKISIPTILNVALFCFLVGIAEEFLCRGWLFNEFLERFSDTKKGIFWSVILSSLIFGCVHFINLSSNQGFIDTFLQVINATVGGIFIALVYYKTKNIWTVVALHSFWDFSLYLGESHLVVDCVSGTATSSIYIYSIIQCVILVVAYLILNYWLLRQTDIIDKKPLTKKMLVILPIIGICLYLSAIFLITSPDEKTYYICPDYQSVFLGSELKTEYYDYSEFDLNYVRYFNNENANLGLAYQQDPIVYDFSMYLNDKTGEVEFKNKNTGKLVSLTSDGAIDYLLINNEDSFAILIMTDNDKVLYSSIMKNKITDEEDFLVSIKDSMKEYYTSEIASIGVIQTAMSDYRYAMVKSIIGDKFYFDEAGNLNILKYDK